MVKKLFLLSLVLTILCSCTVNDNAEQIVENDGQNTRQNETTERDINLKIDEERSINPDVMGWINIEGTSIDYPVVQGNDNEFYLKNDFRKNKSSKGAIFLDYRVDLKEKEQNTMIFGHNMRDRTMFGELSLYKKEDFFRKRTVIKFDTVNRNGKWEIFSAYVLDANEVTMPVNFENSGEYGEFLNYVQGKSMFKTDVSLSKHDEIITLVTCSYETDNSRVVVHARLMSP